MWPDYSVTLGVPTIPPTLLFNRPRHCVKERGVSPASQSPKSTNCNVFEIWATHPDNWPRRSSSITLRKLGISDCSAQSLSSCRLEP